jgi:hypothetical protein
MGNTRRASGNTGIAFNSHGRRGGQMRRDNCDAFAAAAPSVAAGMGRFYRQSVSTMWAFKLDHSYQPSSQMRALPF